MISINDVVFANKHKAVVADIQKGIFTEPNVDSYLVHYCDGVGSDWMPLQCLRKVDNSEVTYA
jgi:hypothetical protein